MKKLGAILHRDEEMCAMTINEDETPFHRPTNSTEVADHGVGSISDASGFHIDETSRSCLITG
jgi:hypothetical protein